jgi:mono/diheme cytochrome c family protein
MMRLAIALCACALAGAFPLSIHALQLRVITDGVYSAAQAERGKRLYAAQCVECHGNELEGSAGPPLAGNDFLSNWSGHPLADIIEKTQKTMPFERPGTLSRQQANDIVAYMLQIGKVPAGKTELTDASLEGISMPIAQSSAAPVSTRGGPAFLPPAGNLAELMRAIHFPNSNIIFNVQLKNPGAEPKKEPPVDFDYVAWGATVYPGWLAVDQAAVAIIETAPLLMTPGRRCQNGRPVPLDRSDWKQYVDARVEAGMFARRASQARNYEAFGEVVERLNNSCANCHMVYRDAGGAEGSGARRCQ